VGADAVKNRRATAWALIGMVVTAFAGPLAAQDEISEVIAFGDSITRGDKRFDTQNKGGYPGRLQNRMRQTDPGAIVHNFGRDGEVTSEGLSRVNNVLQLVRGDAFALMEGTNDIDLVVTGQISFESIERNLAGIASKAANAGHRVFYATLFPRAPTAIRDGKNVLNFALNRDLRDLAYRQQRDLVDIWETFFYEPGFYNRFYFKGSGDVGHPNPAGFDRMADAFFDSVRDVDSQGPVPGDMTPAFNVTQISPGTEIELPIYDFGAGIDRDNTTLTINGEPVETIASGNDRRRILNHDSTAESLGCFARVGILSSDLAEPPNVTDRVYKEFTVAGGQILKGDLNRSCRVDGTDLLIVAFALGSRAGEPRYSKSADINNDSVVDGRDVAELASNFGRSSS
jgi:lysophospholipase L1-like esterase